VDKNSEKLSRIVFIGGSPRSGTTLVQRVLNHHPRIYGGPEFDFIPSIAELYQRMRDSIRSGRIASIIGESELRDVFRELISSLLIPKAEAEGMTILSEKTPGNVLAFKVLKEIAPESKQVFVIRDPRDVVGSILEVGERLQRRLGYKFGFVRDIFAAVNHMNECLQAGCLAAECNENCMVVYYEDFTANPLEEANRIYKFLKVEPLPQLRLSGSEFEIAESKYAPDFRSPYSFGTEIVKNRVGVSKSRLSNAERSYIVRHLVSHELIVGKYQLSAGASAFQAGWCVTKTAARRLVTSFRGLPRRIHRKLLG
jgi:Sulfotransferase domain.